MGFVVSAALSVELLADLSDRLEIVADGAARTLELGKKRTVRAATLRSTG